MNYNQQDILDLCAMKDLFSSNSNKEEFVLFIIEQFEFLVYLQISTKCICWGVNPIELTTIYSRYNISCLAYYNENLTINLLIKEAISKAFLPEGTTSNDRNTIKVVLKSMLSTYYEKIDSILCRFSKEQLVSAFYGCASYFTNIDILQNYVTNLETSDDEVSTCFQNAIVDLLVIAKNKDEKQYSIFISEQKNALNFLIHYLLSTNIQFQNASTSTVPLEQIISLAILISDTIHKLELINLTPANDDIPFTIINSEIINNKQYLEKIDKYFTHLNEMSIVAKPFEKNIILTQYKKENGYNPNDFLKYIKSMDKKLFVFATLLWVEDKFLYRDIANIAQVEYNHAERLVSNFILKKIDKNFEKSICSKKTVFIGHL